MSDTKSRRLRLPSNLREQMVREAGLAYPSEACGLLVGLETKSFVEVSRLARAENRATRSDRYDLDPAAMLVAARAASADGLDIVGVWHSHPDHPAVPSSTDLERAWEGLSYLILGVDANAARELRSWRFVRGVFVEEPVRLVSRA